MKSEVGCIGVIQIIHCESNDVRVAERSEYESSVGRDQCVWQMRCQGKLAGDLQGWGDYNVNRRRIRCKAIVYREYKGGWRISA